MRKYLAYKFILTPIILCLLFKISVAQNRVPFIDTVMVEQNQDNFLVEITYHVFDLDNDPMIVLVKVSDDGGTTFNVPAHTFSGDYGLGILSGSNKKIYWDAVNDYPDQYGVNFRVKLIVSDAKINQLKQIDAGNFSMGEGAGIDDPVHDVYLDQYWISPHEVTNEEYRLFCDMTNRDYPPEGGTYQAPVTYFYNFPEYPVVGVSWYDAVSFCNWLSELEGLDPCYDLMTWEYDSTKNGYHLPTEAQWEKAARGNLVQKIYPWGDEPPGNRCNYNGYSGVLTSIMPDFENDRGPLPVDSLNANGYGLLNMAGNVWEWCNDWYGRNYYIDSPAENPLGPETGYEKVIRGGAWNTSEIRLHCAFRERYVPDTKQYDIGFRIAR